jgi:hypothetical protein
MTSSAGRPKNTSNHLRAAVRSRRHTTLYKSTALLLTAGPNSQTAAAAEIHRVGYAIDVTLGWTESVRDRSR